MSMSSSKLLTPDTAGFVAGRIAQFLADEREGTKNSKCPLCCLSAVLSYLRHCFASSASSDTNDHDPVLFRRNVFDPIWQLLKVQTNPGSSQGSLNWRMVPSPTKLLLMRSFVYVPSSGSTAGADGADYHSSEESVVLALLDEIVAAEQQRLAERTSRQRPPEATEARAESLAGMAKVLRAAVDASLDYEAVRDGGKDSTATTRPSRSSTKRSYVEESLAFDIQEQVVEYERLRKKRARVEADALEGADDRVDDRESGPAESNLIGRSTDVV